MGAAAMNRIASICCQIVKIGEFVTGCEGFSLSSLCQVRDATLDLHDLLAGEILKRERAPLNIKKPDGSAA
jgi:hypothetical protein